MTAISRPGINGRPRWVKPVAIVVGVVVLIGLLFVAPYNGLVSKQAAADRTFVDLDAQLQRRNDLIPNLVNAVKGALNQEQAVFGGLSSSPTATPMPVPVSAKTLRASTTNTAAVTAG